MRIGPGEMKKIIDEGIARKNRDPLEDYWLLVAELNRLFPPKGTKLDNY